jgi:hypothetical protein
MQDRFFALQREFSEANRGQLIFGDASYGKKKARISSKGSREGKILIFIL